MQQNRGGGFFWALISRGDTAQLQQRERARWEPVYRENDMQPAIVLGASTDYAIWAWGPRLPKPPNKPPKGAFDE